MPLMIYTQYTKPEGTIKFDDLVISAKKKGLKYLAITDHGNFSGITEFYSKCLDSGIKPIIGMDFFCRLENEKFIRAVVYIKNYDGYRSLLKILEKLNLQGKCFYCQLKDLSELRNCFLCFSSYKIDILSESIPIESDFTYISSQVTLLDLDQENIFYHILYDDDSYNSEITGKLLSVQEVLKLQLLGSNPVYYVEEGNHKIKELSVRLYGEKCCEKQFRMQFLNSTETVLGKFPESALENRENIVRSCHFIIEDAPVKFPEFKLKGKIEYSCFETFKEETYKILSDQKDEFKSLIYEELAYIRKFNIADIMLFLIEVKNEFYELYNQNLFFSGFVNDLHIAYMFNLTLSSPIFSINDYHRSVLANKKLHPQISVIVSPENRSDLFEYMSERFPKDSICFLSEYAKWHFTSIINSLEKEYKIEKDLLDVLNRHYNINYRAAGQLTDILNIKEVDDELRKYPDQKEILRMSIWMDDVFKNYNTNTNQLVISGDNIRNLLPIGLKNSDQGISCSFYNMNTARHFGVWNINIESNNYPEIRKYFKLGPIRETNLASLSTELIGKIKKDDLSMIPYFTYNHQREKFLEISKNPIFNLILYLESGRSNLNFLITRPSPELPNKRYKKELEITRGFIVFKEQFYFICDKLFSSKEVLFLKKRLLESAGSIQFNSILNQIGDKKDYFEKCEYLRSAFQPTVFYSSLSEITSKVLISLRMLELKSKNTIEFIKYIFLREVNSNGDWRKYILEMQEKGFIFNKMTIANITPKAFCRDMNILMPLFSIKGITEKVSDHIFDFINSNEINRFQDFLEKADKNIVKHNIIDIMVKIGFFDIFNPNRRELANLNDEYFKSLKKDDAFQPVLFESSAVAIETDSAFDYSFSEKRNFEEEYTGIIFTGLPDNECELCGLVKLKQGQEIKIDNTVYGKYNFILYVSLESGDGDLLTEFSKMLSDSGNCGIEILFSDTNETMKMTKYLSLNGIIVYQLKKLFKNIPFYIEIVEERNA